jgi:hypothetical protein
MRGCILSLATVVVACAPAIDEFEAEADGKADRVMAPVAPTFYSLESDGKGWLAARVGRASTTCADGSVAARCPVSAPDLGDDLTGLIVRGRIARDGTLVVDEAFRNPAPAPAATLYQLSDRGLRCAAAPCFTMIAEKLNSTVNVTLSGLAGDLADRVAGELAAGPLLVAGAWRTTSDGGRVLAPAQLWSRVEPDPARCSVDSDCEATAYSRPVATAAECFCPSCEDAVVNRATAEANRRSWEEQCAGVRLACGGAACVPAPRVACVASRCAVAE